MNTYLEEEYLSGSRPGLKKLGLFIFISLLLLQVILTPEMQERIRQNRERALAKRRAAHERQAEETNTQKGED